MKQRGGGGGGGRPTGKLDAGFSTSFRLAVQQAEFRMAILLLGSSETPVYMSIKGFPSLPFEPRNIKH